MSASDYLETAVGDHILRGSVFDKPQELYLALFTETPNEDGTGGTEVDGGSYARQKVGPSDDVWDPPSQTGSSGRYANAQDIAFPEPTADWGTVVSFGLFDAQTGGNLLLVVDLASAKTIVSGDAQPVFLAGDLIINFE